MNRRGFFGWLGAVGAWCAGVKAQTITLPPLTLDEIKDAPKVNAEWECDTVKFDYYVPVATVNADGTWSIRSEIRTGTLRKLQS